LVRVSADGKSVTTIANGAAGVALAVDTAGNYVVAAKTALLRVTPRGVVTVIAKAPEDAEWVSVAVDLSGSLIVADGKQPAVWRVSSDGKSTRKVEYDNFVRPLGGGSASVVAEASGDCLLLIDGWNHLVGSVARVYRISPADVVTETPVLGERTRLPAALVPDGTGQYYYVNKQPFPGGPGSQVVTILRLTAGGLVTKFAEIAYGGPGEVGMARNPQTGGLVVSEEFPGRLLSISADASTVTTLAAYGKLTAPTAVVVDSAR
jgi:sugar lactone lactonase YvrE